MQKQESEYVLSVENQMDLPASRFHVVLRILFQIFVLYRFLYLLIKQTNLTLGGFSSYFIGKFTEYCPFVTMKTEICPYQWLC